MELGTITDGVSQDLEEALRIISETELRYVEIQFIWEKEIGDQTDDEVQKIRKLLRQYNKKLSCITRHNFVGLPALTTRPEDEIYQEHTRKLRRCMQIAHELECPIVRIMSCRKEMILFGLNGADEWVTAQGAWDAQVRLMEPPVRMAEKEGVTLVTETCNGGMITSNYLAAKIIKQIGSDNLRILWDPCNSLYCTERAYPEGYEAGKKYIRHIHIKDARIDIAKARVEFRSLGQGDMAPYLLDISRALKRDNYAGVVSLESNYRPDNKGFLDGFRSSINTFVKIFS